MGKIRHSPKFIRKIAEIAEMSEIKNNAAEHDQNRLHPLSQSIVTCSERHKENGRITVVPLAPSSLWEGTAYTVATRPSNRGRERTQKNDVPTVTTKPKSIGLADQRKIKVTSSTGLHKKTTNKYMVLDVHAQHETPHDTHSHNET